MISRGTASTNSAVTKLSRSYRERLLAASFDPLVNSEGSSSYSHQGVLLSSEYPVWYNHMVRCVGKIPMMMDDVVLESLEPVEDGRRSLYI